MSECLKRIIQNVTSRSAFGVRVPLAEEDDCSLSYGDWQDCIGLELHTLKQRLTVMEADCRFSGLTVKADELAALIEDL